MRRKGTKRFARDFVGLRYRHIHFQIRQVQSDPMPECEALPISVKSPTVFRETVFPPVFGPVTMRRSNVSPSVSVIGTTLRLSRSGWRPSRIWIRPSVLRIGLDAFMLRAREPRNEVQIGHNLVVGANGINVIRSVGA